jgi:hypothetical protein
VEVEVKPVPVIVKVWAEVDPVTGFGLTLLICSVCVWVRKKGSAQESDRPLVLLDFGENAAQVPQAA